MRFGIALAIILWLGWETMIGYKFPNESNDFYLMALKLSIIPIVVGFLGGWWIDPFRPTPRALDGAKRTAPKSYITSKRSGWSRRQ